MSSPEQPHPPPPADRYVLSVRYTDEQRSSEAYFAAQDAIYRTPRCDLSVYRLAAPPEWLVAVLGFRPPRPLDRQLRRILSHGETILLPEEIIDRLWQRRAEAIRLGPWIERHIDLF